MLMLAIIATTAPLPLADDDGQPYEETLMPRGFTTFRNKDRLPLLVEDDGLRIVGSLVNIHYEKLAVVADVIFSGRAIARDLESAIREGHLQFIQPRYSVQRRERSPSGNVTVTAWTLRGAVATIFPADPGARFIP